MKIKIKVDPLGRIVIPFTIREKLNIKSSSYIIVKIEGNKFIVGKQK